MRFERVIITLLAMFTMVGCGTKKHLNRKQLLSESHQNLQKAGLRAYKSPGGDFSGNLKLLYEKKIKGSADSPLLTYRGVLGFNSTRQRFLAFDQFTGDKLMRVKHRRGFVLDPIIADSLLVVIKRSGYGKIQVRNILTGKMLHERVVKEIRSGPIIVSERLIFGTIGGLLTLTLPELNTAWRTSEKTTVDIPAVADSQVIYYATAAGIIKAVQAHDGQEIWAIECGSSVVSELNLGDYLYAGIADGRFVAIDLDNGEIVWDQPFEFQIHGGAAEYDGRVYFGDTEGWIYCLSVTSGEMIWKYQTDGVITAAPIVYGAAVLVGSHDRHFYSFDRLNGELVERRRLEGPISLTAAVDNDRIFVTCRKNRLYCFEGKP